MNGDILNNVLQYYFSFLYWAVNDKDEKQIDAMAKILQFIGNFSLRKVVIL